MTVCKRVRAIIGALDPLPAELAAHAEGCPACQAALAGFARLDALLGSEPILPAPPDLLLSIRAELAHRRARERARAIRQLAGLVAAAAIVVTAGLGLLELVGPVAPELPAWRPDLSPVESYVETPETAWSGLLASLQSSLASAGGSLPSFPLLLPALLAPLLLLANRALCNPAPRARGRALAPRPA